MVAVRTRSRRARQKVSDGNPRSGADRGGRANKARAPASSSPNSRSLSASRGHGPSKRLAASSAGDFDLAGVGAYEMVERPRRSLSRRQAFGFFAIVWLRSKGQFAVFAHLRSHAKLESLPRRRRSKRGDTASEKCHARFRHDGFDAKFNVEATVLQVSRDSRTRAAVERASCTTTRATRTDRGPQARIKNYFIQPRPTSEIQHDAAATNASKPKMKSRRARPVTTAGARIRSPRSQRSPRSRRRASPPAWSPQGAAASPFTAARGRRDGRGRRRHRRLRRAAAAAGAAAPTPPTRRPGAEDAGAAAADMPCANAAAWLRLGVQRRGDRRRQVARTLRRGGRRRRRRRGRTRPPA